MKVEQWNQLASLLDSDCSFIDALKILGKYTDKIDLYLKEGNSINSLILKENKGKFYEYLSFFLNYNPLSKAILSAYKIYFFERELLHSFVKKSSYPLFIFFISILSIVLFARFIVPQLSVLFTDINDNVFLMFLINIKNYIVYTLILLIILLIVLFILSSFNKTNYYLFQFFYSRFNILKQILCYQLSGYIVHLNESGLSTFQSFKYLSTVKNKSIYYISNDIQNCLLQGIHILDCINNNPLIDPIFKTYFNIGYKNTELNKQINIYRNICEIKFNTYIKKLSIYIQCISYSFVTILIISVYQILLIPLELLNQL